MSSKMFIEDLLKQIIKLIQSFLNKTSSPPMSAHVYRTDLHTIEKENQLMSTATLTWTNPTTRTDGSAFTPDMIMEIDVFDTPDVPAVPPANLLIGTVPGAGTTFTTGVLTTGVHNFTVVVRDTTGHSSAASNVATLTVTATAANPSAVTDLKAVLSDGTTLPTPAKAWDATVTYDKDAQVLFTDGITYKSVSSGNLNNIPSATSTFWTVVLSTIGTTPAKPAVISAWNATTTYNRGDMVTFQGGSYTSAVDKNLASTPLTGSSANWTKTA